MTQDVSRMKKVFLIGVRGEKLGEDRGREGAPGREWDFAYPKQGHIGYR